MIKRGMTLLLCLLLFVASVLPLAAATPQNSAVSQALAAVKGSVGADTPGAALLLFENGERVMYEGYGYADIGARTLVTAQTCFEIGSISSLFVSLAAAKLCEEGKLDFERDVAYYLPADFHKKLGLSYNITLNNLLSGRAGFADRLFDLRYDSASLRFDTLEEALLADLPEQISVPHTYTAYSPFSVALAAFVVESVAKMPFDAYVQEVLLHPLGMYDTVLNPTDSSAEELAVGHLNVKQGEFAVAAKGGHTYSALYPADGAISNIADLSALLSFLLNDNVGAGVLSPAYRAMALDTVFSNGIFSTGMVGMSASENARGMITSVPYFSASLAFDRVNGKAVLVLANVANCALLQLPASLCGLSRGVSVTPSAQLPALATFVGEYLPQTLADNRLATRHVEATRVTQEGDRLRVGDQLLVQIAPGIFAKVDGEKNMAVLQFVLSVEGEVLFLVTKDGDVLRTASFFESNGFRTFLFVLLIVGIVYFLLGAVLYVADAVRDRHRGEEEPRPWSLVLPWIFAALLSIGALAQIILSALGGHIFASLFAAGATVSILCAIVAGALFLFGLFSAPSVRGKRGRVWQSVIVYAIFLIVCGYWSVIFL